MKIKLIHNNNINFKLIESFENPFFFGVSKQALLRKGFNFDEHIHNELIECFEDGIQYDLIVIPSSLSIENYIEFTGLRVALHIRLTPEFRHTRAPILFISKETPIQIGKLIALANLFFTKGIFHSSNQASKKLFNEINKLKKSGLKILSESDYNNFLEKIKIEPPPNFDNRHSVANEYTIHSWSKAIGLKNEKIEKELGSRLYFKYQDSINQNNQVETINIGEIDSKLETKVLLIDDEAEKGWGQFYKKLLGNDKLIVPEIDYNAGSEKIKDDVIKLIKTEKPHLVLLDLRLSDEDTSKSSSLTGVQIIKELDNCKDINRGTRVVITSASNKIWNYLDAGIRNSDFFENIIVKSNENKFSKHPIENIQEVIINSLEKSYFLMDVSKSLNIISDRIKGFSTDYFNTIKNSFDISFKLVRIGFNEPKYLSYAYLELFKIIEGFINQPDLFYEDSDNLYTLVNDEKCLVAYKIKEDTYESNYGYSDKVSGYDIGINEIKKKKNFDTDLICQFVLFYSFGGLQKHEWISINWDRNNKAVHQGKKAKGVIKSEDIFKILEFLKFITNPKNRNKKNFIHCVKNNIDEKLNDLQNKFKKH